MKVAIITDQHFGFKKGSKHFHSYFKKFYDNIFFPTLEERGITTVIDMGDTFDSRKGIDLYSLDWAQRNYFDRLRDMGCKLTSIVGNHTAFYKNTNDINAPQELMSWSNVYSEPKVVERGGMKMLYLPWVTPENIERTTMMLEQESADIVLGHLEIKGFLMNNGHVSDTGLDKKLFRRFEKVLTGHFHKKSDDGQIYYLGSQYEFTWHDYNCPKGFHILDTETRELERIVVNKK